MNTFSFKKLLSLLATLTVVTTTSINIVACGNKEKKEKKSLVKDKDKTKNSVKYAYYGVNDKYYYSKQEALDDQIEKNVKTTSENDLLKDVTLGDKSFQSLDEMYDAIEKEYNITTLATKKDPKNFVVDAMGQLSPNVATDGLETSVVYRDINGKAIDAKPSESEVALKKTQESYLSQIEKKYVVDDQYFNNQNDILSYYENKYKTKEAKDLKSSTCYKISNSCVEEDELKEILERSLNFKFQYNGEWIEQNQINDLSKIKLTNEDENKIQRFSQSPGTFLIEQTDKADGLLSGSSVFQAPDEIANIVHNKSNWDLKETSTTTLLDHLAGGLLSSGISLIAQLIAFSDLLNGNEERLYCLGNPDGQLHLKELMLCHAGEKSYQTVNQLIHKYEIVDDMNSIIFNLNDIETLDPATKEKIVMYQLTELFKSSNITRSDANELNGIWKNYLADFDKSDAWQKIVTEFETYDISSLFEYLVNPSSITTIGKHASAFNFKNLIGYITDYNDNEVKKMVDEAGNKMLEKLHDNFLNREDYLGKLVLKKFTDVNLDITTTIAKWTAKIVRLGKLIPVIGLFIKIIDSIPIQKTYTYQLRIPRTTTILNYQFRKWAWQSDDFDPALFFKVLEIKKPITATKYLYEGRYYASLESAKTALKLDIIDDTINSQHVSYYSNYYPSITENNKATLETRLLAEAKKQAVTYYLDHFGGYFDNADDALRSMLNHIKEKQFNTIYMYRDGPSENNVIYDDSLENIRKRAIEKLHIDKKTVIWTDLLATRNFEELEDVSKFTYDIYQLNINGKAYYFNSNVSAMYYVMKVKNFSNIITKITKRTYEYKDHKFTSKEELEDYILSDIKAYTGSSEQEVKERVGY